MRRWDRVRPLWAQTEPIEGAIPGEPVRRSGRRGTGERGSRSWFAEPKAAVWLALAAAVAVGGARQLLRAWRARRAVARLDESNVTAREIEAVAEHGRAGVWELLRIFSTSPLEPHRQAAGRALARLWLLDQLVAEEEQAIVKRGYAVIWSARRRYPRAIEAEIPIVVSYEVPFLDDAGDRVSPANLEWAHRILGARRATLEELSPWTAGNGRVSFTIVPGDFPTNGPHRLVLQTRVRTTGLTDSWEIELAHIPFNFEFDPRLELGAILTLPDAVRDEQIARAIRLETPETAGEASTYLPLGDEWTLRNPPRLAVAIPLPCDLAHAISIEFEGIEGRFPGGRLVVSGQGLPQRGALEEEPIVRRFELKPTRHLPAGLIAAPGRRRMRIWLEADLESGWADPLIRSIWPGRSQTNWVEVEIVRR
jgi:hypothetical protein